MAIVPWLQVPLGFVMADIVPLGVIGLFAFVFPLFAVSLTIIGIVTLSRRNKLSKKEKEKKKDEKIEELENRLKKVEEEKSKSDDNPENS